MSVKAVLSTLQKPFDDTFGNYLLHGMHEVYLPEPVAWWPQTLAWQVLAVLLLLAAAYSLFCYWRSWRANRYRRDALAKLAEIEQQSTQSLEPLLQLPVLLKATALKVYPRHKVARLSGQNWLDSLNHDRPPIFTASIGLSLTTVAYQPIDQWQFGSEQRQDLLNACRAWIKSHKATDSRFNND